MLILDNYMDRKLEDLLKNPTKSEQMKLNMYFTLLGCIKDVGGHSDHFERDIIHGMTVLELIDALGPNRVTFSVIS
jgi:hypothetical protein